MKAKSKPKAKVKEEKPKPELDEILTISKGDEGRAMLQLRKEPAEVKVEEEAPAQKEEKTEKVFRLPKKPKSIIPTKAPKAAAVKSVKKAPKIKMPKKVAKKFSEPVAKKEKPVYVEKPFEAPSLKDNFIFGSDVSAVVSESKKEAQPEKRLAPLETSKQAVAEAALFLSPKPLMIDELARIMGVSSLGYVKETLEKLAKDYESRGIEIVSSPAGWEMQVKPGYLNSVAHLAPYADLSEGPKRALALILFKEPLKQSDLIKMQGNKVYDYLKHLDKLGMIKREPYGRTKLLSLTKEFERYFGEEKEAVKARLAQELANVKVADSVDKTVKMERKQMTVEEAAKKFKIDVDLSAEE